MSLEKRKILNDPVYGFINMPKGLSFQLIEHGIFQRLRRIKQLGLTYYVYPGAIHTRFQHTLGAFHLMTLALDTLRIKEVPITDKEYESAQNAILLHDIGHGPFSHSLEHSIIGGISHEALSLAFMEYFNTYYDGSLDTAIQIFKNEHQKKFLHQLVSSQLDVDRLDYLRRDSFFTGVSEGIVGSDRIIKMLNVHKNNLVVDVKGVYSIEKFLIARRFMYWQVYLHKTVVVAEQLLIRLLKRAKELAINGESLFATPAFEFFLYNNIQLSDLNEKSGIKNYTVLELFAQLDDNDIMASVKTWLNHKDPILSFLSQSLMDRKLYKITLQKQSFNPNDIKKLKAKIKQTYSINDNEIDYFLLTGTVSNKAYNIDDGNINILQKDKTLLDIGESSDILNLSLLSKTAEKYYLSHPKNIEI